jgi:hypothetical protein
MPISIGPIELLILGAVLSFICLLPLVVIGIIIFLKKRDQD